ncbi:pheromone-binding protein Gp-9-like [Temnothorax nylanderi]|uniref:pheromone-binding protein Gp-9-like n=1 Tax=Temnothorax nylanderi TaxID=102681 RepID=UPI003A862366
MEKLIFYICNFALISFTVGTKLGSSTEHYNTCLTENNVSDDDMLTVQDVISTKTSSILRMLQHVLTDDVFWYGVKSHLKA